MRHDLHEFDYPLQVAARRSGLTPRVIRDWETRHGAVVPRRSPGNRRRYRESDIDRLLLLRRATEAGLRIAAVADWPTERLRLELDPARVDRRPTEAPPTASRGPGNAAR